MLRFAGGSQELPLPLGGTATSNRGARGSQWNLLIVCCFIAIFFISFFLVFGSIIRIQQNPNDGAKHNPNFPIFHEPNLTKKSDSSVRKDTPVKPEPPPKEPPIKPDASNTIEEPPVKPDVSKTTEEPPGKLKPEDSVATQPDSSEKKEQESVNTYEDMLVDSFFADDTLNYSDTEVRREIARRVFDFALTNYENRALGADELEPIAGRPFNNFNYAFTLIDAMSTSLVMNFTEHYRKLRDYVVSEKFEPYNRGRTSVFESIIRVLGGLESAYALSGENDPELLSVIVTVMNTLMPAFKTSTGIPSIWVNVRQRDSFSPSMSGTTIAECGSMQLELSYLSRITGDPRYQEMGIKIIKLLAENNHRSDGLFGQAVNMHTGGTFGVTHVGGASDSFYEYLVKMYVMFKNDAREKGREIAEFFKGLAIHALRGALKLEKKSAKGYSFLSDDHLGCFVGGMYALGSDAIEGLDPEERAQFFDAAERFTTGCYMVYNSSPTGLAPQFFDLKAEDGNLAKKGGETFLRPEAIESCFYMWRYTHDQKYREMGWNMFRAMIKHQKRRFGFTGLHDALNINSSNDHQPSWFFAETTKYVYLLFSDDDVISLDKYVFNTEAHPLPLVIVDEE